MTKQTDIRVVESNFKLEHIAYRTPIKFGGRVVTDVTLFHAELYVEARDGKVATGYGSMPMGNVWAWPSADLEAEQTLAIMIDFAKAATTAVGQLDEWGHPIELAHLLSSAYSGLAKTVVETHGLNVEMPRLAQLVAGSPIDAALHDAFGRAHSQNAYHLLGEQYVNSDLSHWLGSEFKGEYLGNYVSKTPKAKIPLYHLVGALDPVRDSELKEPVGDGLPETLFDWIVADGLSHLKIKLNGEKIDWDVERVAAINEVAERAGEELGRQEWNYSLDFNEKCESEQYVLEFLREIQSRSPNAYDRVQYIEQPTHRDLKSHPDQTMHEVAQLKPVVIDESLVDLESLEMALQRGYSGIALKGCKGHTEALLMGAVAQKRQCFLCVQDLTCVGASFLHSSSLAAWLPTVMAIEGNGRQYCPAGNVGWDQKYPSMFDINDGTVGTGCLDEVGLGFSMAATT